MLELIALPLAILHFAVPLSYYAYMKREYYGKPWDIEGGDVELSAPKLSIIIPTYNEAALIKGKLENVAEQDYPSDKLEILVVDSASEDGTADLAEMWAAEHESVNVSVLREDTRKGKAKALNEALKHISGEIVIITDADSKWVGRDTLRKVAKYMSSNEVGAVSCVKVPEGPGMAGIESGYREFYNVLRIAESKAYSTPIFHGELAAFRRELLEEVGGFPTDIGADDSHTATLIALKGYRAITPEDLLCREAVPRKGYASWRIRRAQHLIQHFLKSVRVRGRAPRIFRMILGIEAFLHVVNPWLLALSAALLLASASGSWFSMALLALGFAAFPYRPYRTWMAAQAYLMIAFLRNLRSKEIVWEKQVKVG